MKKTLALVLTLMLAATAFVACNKENTGDNVNDDVNNEIENEVENLEGENTENEGDVEGEGNVEGEGEAEGEGEYVPSELEALVNKIYETKQPQFMLMTMPVDLTDEFSYTTYLGIKDPSVIAEAVVSESMIGAQAYSLVVAKVADGQDAAKIAEEMKANIDPRKWICVEADDVKVTTSGNYICFCMIDSEFAPDFTAQDAMDAFAKAIAE